MANWTSHELQAMGAADDLHVSPFRDDGATYGTPTWIWSVVVGPDLFVRAYYGLRSRWYQAALSQKAGRVTVAGMTRDVAFDPVATAALSDAIDDAYRRKYAGSQYLGHMIAAGSRAATMKITPRN